jgi:hypothetical protein
MAVSFNGTTDVIDMGPNTPLTIGNNQPMSLMCWINFASLSGIQVFIARGFDNTAGTACYEFFLASATTITIQSVDTGGSVGHGVTGTMAWSIGQWHHVYADYTGPLGTPANTWRIYFDGVSANTHVDTTGPINNTVPFTVGALRETIGGPYIDFTSACIADVALLNGPLTPTEISSLAGGSVRPNGGMSQTLLGYWSLDTVGVSQTDLSGNSNTGIYTQTTPSPCGSGPPFGQVINVPTFTQSPILQVRSSVLSY